MPRIVWLTREANMPQEELRRLTKEEISQQIREGVKAAIEQMSKTRYPQDFLDRPDNPRGLVRGGRRERRLSPAVSPKP